jgi:alkyl sulfatase BDS1-like metallo-beta-lactamase superfamily hydrolase
MGEILDLAEALWQEETDVYTHHPLTPLNRIERIADDTWFFKGVANTIITETSDGLIIVDPSGFTDGQIRYEATRSVTRQRLNTAIYTHGHMDHIFGVSNYFQEATSKDWPHPQVIAHEAILSRFQRYRETASWNGFINLRQFLGGTGEFIFPQDFYRPDITYADRMTIRVGEVKVLLRHTRGETDDHTWLFFPDTRVLCTGDLFIWAIPNAGNPQKVQRYAKEWAESLLKMAALKPEILAPGHGFPIVGADRVCQALEDTGALFESIHAQTLALMNNGASLDTVLNGLKIPEELSKRPYLQPVYDEPEFIARNIWRLYGGWYDGIPSHLKPSPMEAQAEEICRLAGGVDKLLSRIEELLEGGNLRLACHLADWAYLSSPGDAKVREITSQVYATRAETETSTMAIGIYRTAANEMGGKSGDTKIQENVIQYQNERGKPPSGA